MPRGNLEAVHPRFLLLQQVLMLIDGLEYGRAFRLLRQHKLDINLMHDANPIDFLLNIDKFVAEVPQVDHLNLFINSLVPAARGKELEFMRPLPQEERLNQEQQAFIRKFESSLVPTQGAQTAYSSEAHHYEKVNNICDTLREALEIAGEEQGDSNRYLLPILTTYIKKQPQELKQVLARIAAMKAQEEEAQVLFH